MRYTYTTRSNEEKKKSKSILHECIKLSKYLNEKLRKQVP